MVWSGKEFQDRIDAWEADLAKTDTRYVPHFLVALVIISGFLLMLEGRFGDSATFTILAIIFYFTFLGACIKWSLNNGRRAMAEHGLICYNCNKLLDRNDHMHIWRLATCARCDAQLLEVDDVLLDTDWDWENEYD